MRSVFFAVLVGSLLAGCSLKELADFGNALDRADQNSGYSSNRSSQYNYQPQVDSNTFKYEDKRSGTYKIRPVGSGYYRVEER